MKKESALAVLVAPTTVWPRFSASWTVTSRSIPPSAGPPYTPSQAEIDRLRRPYLN
jgi:hypothetical protein